MSSNLLSFVGWTFLPDLVTGWVQTVYYGIAIRVGDRKPEPGSARYARDRRRIHILVISLYLLYTIYEADWEVRRAGDFYQTLGLRPDVQDKEIKSRFRRLAALHHPDKQTSPDSRAAAEASFVHLKLAQETLLNPAKRFAYERFGPSVNEWRHCSSVRDYILMGVQTVAPYYVAGLLFMIILTTLGYFEGGRYWRYFSTLAFLTFELHTVTRPYFPPFTKVVNPLLQLLTNHPPLLPFQLLILGRRVILTLFIAFGQLGPLLSQSAADARRGAAPSMDSDVSRRRQLDRLDQLSRAAETEATQLLTLDMTPFAASARSLTDLKTGLKSSLVRNKIRSHPEVVSAMRVAMARRAEQHEQDMSGRDSEGIFREVEEQVPTGQ